MSDPEAPQDLPVSETALIDPLVTSIVELDIPVSVYSGKADCPAVETSADNLVRLMTILRDDARFSFDMLTSHTAIDRIDKERFELVYYLYSLTHRKRLLVSVSIPRENPVAPTLCSIWKIAEWQEREVYDLFGVQYDNHPDLRRVFLEDDWKGFPLRKDYSDDFMLTWELPER